MQASTVQITVDYSDAHSHQVLTLTREKPATSKVNQLQAYLSIDEDCEVLMPLQLKTAQVVACTEEKHIASASEMVSALLNKMIDAPFFSTMEKMMVEEWQETLPVELFDDLDGGERSEFVSDALCYLLCKIVNPALCRAKEKIAKKALLKLSDELNEILHMCLPKGENINDFIFLYEKFSREEMLYKQKCLILAESSKIALKQLCSNANAADERLIDKAELDQQKLLNVTHNRRLIAKSADDRIQTLSQKMSSTLVIMAENASHLESIANKMQYQHEGLQQSLIDCQSKIRNFKI